MIDTKKPYDFILQAADDLLAGMASRAKDRRRATAFAGIVEDIETLTIRATSLQRRLKSKRRAEKDQA